MNGLYLQLHAYMLRIAVPYGTLSARQLRKLAHIARKYDKGYGHFTTRQNIQFNWIKLMDVPDMLADLAEVEMHCLQTSGNCIRNVTADHFAGAVADEMEDPRILAEIVRQWSTLHPEFTFLPRKFKIAVSGTRKRPRGGEIPRYRNRDREERGRRSRLSRAGRRRHGTHALCRPGGRRLRGAQRHSCVPRSVMRVYNEEGRRDNIYKARIKILVHTLASEMRRAVVREFAEQKAGTLPSARRRTGTHRRLFRAPAFDDAARSRRRNTISPPAPQNSHTGTKNNLIPTCSRAMPSPPFRSSPSAAYRAIARPHTARAALARSDGSLRPGGNPNESRTEFGAAACPARRTCRRSSLYA